MSRAIRLSRIHAINWYGYNDSLAVEGHLLLAGVTGSGKSVLMDLIQLVLVGSDRALFNRSATGTTSDRTLKGYCLLDTKREENGLPQYVRQSAKSYVALEFAWPKGDRVETWGLRIEYLSTYAAIDLIGSQRLRVFRFVTNDGAPLRNPKTLSLAAAIRCRPRCRRCEPWFLAATSSRAVYSGNRLNRLVLMYVPADCGS